MTLLIEHGRDPLNALERRCLYMRLRGRCRDTQAVEYVSYVMQHSCRDFRHPRQVRCLHELLLQLPLSPLRTEALGNVQRDTDHAPLRGVRVGDRRGKHIEMPRDPIGTQDAESHVQRIGGLHGLTPCRLR